MSINYEKVGWNPSIYFGPTNMNHMDDGIKAACDGVDELKDKAGATDISKIGDGTVTGAVAQNAKDIAAVNSNLSQIGDVIIVPTTEHTLSLGWNSSLVGGSIVIPAGTYLVTTHFRTSTTAQGVLICSSSITERITGGVKTADYWDMSNTVIAVLGQSAEVKYNFYNTCEDGVKVSVGLEALRIR